MKNKINLCLNIEKNVIKFFNYLEKYNINKVLDVGCGDSQYKDYIKCKEYIGIELQSHINAKNKFEKNTGIYNGLDVDRRKADIFYNGKDIPFENNNFDLVFALMVIEHADDPQKLLQEMIRVVKPNKYVLVKVPYLTPEHEIPYDFLRLTSFGLKKLFKDNNLEIIKYEKYNVGIDAIIALLLEELFKYNTLRYKQRSYCR